MSRGPLARRYWDGLTGRRAAPDPLRRRAREGHGLWERYVAGLLDMPLSVRDTTDPAAAIRRTERAPTRLVLADLGRYLLPQPPPRGAVTAADAGETLVVRAAGPDQGIEFLLHRSAGAVPDHLLEIVLRAPAELPAVVTIWYHTTDGPAEREVRVPLAAPVVGPPGALVRLELFDETAPWSASPPIPPGQVEEWDAATVTASIALAADEATLRAWRVVADRLDEATSRVIRSRLP